MAEGIAPTVGQVDDIDWSDSPDAAVLGRLFEACQDVDAARRRQVEALIRVLETDAAEAVLGVPVEAVLSQTGRLPRHAATRLLTAAHLLVRMPALRAAFAEGWVSWAQVDAIVWHTRDLPVARLADIDALVADRAVASADAEADSLVVDVEWLAVQLAAERQHAKEREPVEQNRAWLTPRLDGSGTIRGDYDPTHFPLLAQAVDDAAGQLTDAASGTDACDGPGAPDHHGQVDAAVDDLAVTDAGRHAANLDADTAARRGHGLFALVTGRHHDTLTPVDADTADGTGGRPAGTAAVTLTCELDTLLDGHLPASVLTKLTGRMRVTADVARRWTDTLGTTSRLIVMDHGQPVGIGRARKDPPGWLRDAVIARDLHDTAPGSTTSALVCDVEHTVAWSDGGTTDIDNLALVSRRWHARKTNGHLTVTRNSDGTTDWTTTTSGYRTRTHPSPHLPGLEPPVPAALDRLTDVPPALVPDADDGATGGSDRDGRAPP